MSKKMTFEGRIKRLQDIVSCLERGDLPLEESVIIYKEGLALSRSCREQLEQARTEVRVLTEGQFKPFDPETAEE